MKFGQHSAKVNLFEREAKRKQKSPAPWQYIQSADWTKENSKDNLQVFLKGERITETDKILARKKLKEPGPSTYKIKFNLVEKKSKQPPKATSPQIQMFDHYKIVSKETPGHVYDITKSYNFI